MKQTLIYIFFIINLGLKSQVSLPGVHPDIVLVQNPMTPYVMLDFFARHHPDAIPYWSCEGKNYTVRFVDPATDLAHMLTFDRHGVIIKSHSELRLDECPESLREYCTKNYPRSAVRIWLYEELQGDRKYYVNTQSSTQWFDQDGQVIRKRFLGL